MSNQIPKAAVFEKTYRKYLRDLQGLDLTSIGAHLHCPVQGEAIILPFFSRTYHISATGIFDTQCRSPDLAVCVVLCQYLFHNEAGIPPFRDWASFRDFPNAQPLVGSFGANVDQRVTKHYAGRLESLQEACTRLGGCASGEDLPYDLHVRFDALPQFPLLFLFNDADDEFPAACRVLFRADADRRIDMESLAILGMLFADRLVQLGGGR